MSLWKRLGRLLPDARTGSAITEAVATPEPLPAVVESRAPVPEAEPMEAPARDLDALFQVVEVADADFLVGDLFRRRFGTDSFPRTPKHFVAFYRDASGGLLPLGYVHFEIWEGQAMGGGLVIDERLYRRVPTADRQLIRARGGVAELLLGTSIAMLPQDLIGIWGYVGNKQAEKVDLRVGFRHTGAPHVMVIWRNEPDEAGKAHWLQKVVEYGSF